MRPQVGVGALSTGDPLLESFVGVGPVLVEVVVLRVQQIVNCGSQPLRARSRSLRCLDIVLREVGPCLWDTNGRVNLLDSSMDVDCSVNKTQKMESRVPHVYLELLWKPRAVWSTLRAECLLFKSSSSWCLA